jgi:hypothetical protein
MLEFATRQAEAHFSSKRLLVTLGRDFGDWAGPAGYAVSFVATAADGYYYQYAEYDMSNRHRLAISVDRAVVEGSASLGGALAGGGLAGEVSGGNEIVIAIGAIGGSALASEASVTAFDGYVATHGSSPLADTLHNIGEALKNGSPSWPGFNFG